MHGGVNMKISYTSYIPFQLQLHHLHLSLYTTFPPPHRLPQKRFMILRCRGTKNAEGIMQGLVINGRVQTLHKDIAGRILSALGVALTPHHSAGFTFDAHVVQRFQGSFSLLKGR